MAAITLLLDKIPDRCPVCVACSMRAALLLATGERCNADDTSEKIVTRAATAQAESGRRVRTSIVWED
jgi:hypothetical protein